MNSEIITFFKKIYSRNSLLKRISFYLLIICFLLAAIFFKINEMNNSLVYLKENINPNYTTTEKDKYNSVLEVFTEKNEQLGEYLPQYDESVQESTTKENVIETTTKKHSIIENTDKENTTTIIETTTNKVTEKERSSTTTTKPSITEDDSSVKIQFVINKNSKKIHYNDCSFVNRMKEENKEIIKLNKSELNSYINNGYSLCSTCGGK